MRVFILAVTVILCAGCQSVSDSSREPIFAAPIGDSSRTSVDWPGTYEGTLPCADCPGIDIKLVLHEDGSYEKTTFYQDSGARPETVHGIFTWDIAGGRITLDEAGGRQSYRVGESRLDHLDMDGNLIKGPLAEFYVLPKTGD